MIQMELAPNNGPHRDSYGGHVISQDPSYSPHQESVGSEGMDGDPDQMQHDSKRKRKFNFN